MELKLTRKQLSERITITEFLHRALKSFEQTQRSAVSSRRTTSKLIQKNFFSFLRKNCHSVISPASTLSKTMLMPKLRSRTLAFQQCKLPSGYTECYVGVTL